MAVITTIVIKRPDKSVPFYYAEKVLDKRYISFLEEAKKIKDVVQTDNKVSQDGLTWVTTMVFEDDKKRDKYIKDFMKKFPHFMEARQNYCDEHNHIVEVTHYV